MAESRDQTKSFLTVKTLMYAIGKRLVSAADCVDGGARQFLVGRPIDLNNLFIIRQLEEFFKLVFEICSGLLVQFSF